MCFFRQIVYIFQYLVAFSIYPVGKEGRWCSWQPLLETAALLAIILHTTGGEGRGGDTSKTKQDKTGQQNCVTLKQMFKSKLEVY